MRHRAFVLLLLAACAGKGERAPVSRPSPPVASAPANVETKEEPRPPSAGDVKPSDVLVTGGFGAAKDRFLRPGDPKPGDAIEAVRFTCEGNEKKTCKAASGVSQSAMSGPFEERLRECFIVKSRAATAAEVARVTAAMNSESGRLDVPAGRLFVIEQRVARREEIMATHECPKDARERHPCDPVRSGTGQFVETSDAFIVAVGPRGSDVSVPFRTWNLSSVELRHLAEPVDTVDVSTLPMDARAAVVFDRAVEAVRSRDRKRVAAAVKVVDANVTIADGTRIEDQRINRTLAQTIVNEMPIIRAVAEGRATVGDACKRNSSAANAEHVREPLGAAVRRLFQRDMKTSDVIITWLDEHEDFEGAPTEPMLRAADDLAETTEIEVSASAAAVPAEHADNAERVRR